MAENSSSLKKPDDSAAPIERRSILLRGYVEAKPPPKRESPRWRQSASRFTLFWDTETTDDAAQRLRFGCYQVWNGDLRADRGIFYDPDAVKPTELAELRRVAKARGHRLMPASEFIDQRLYRIANARGTIVGFNLPFDISRLAIGHDTARVAHRQDGTVDRSMQGGFTFKLSSDPTNGNLRVKHLSRRAAFINFTAAERGFFLDLRTLAAALTSQSHTLDSLAKLLKSSTSKAQFTDFSRDIDEEFISYAIDDVEVTRQCHEKLIAEYAKHGLTDTWVTRIYSEASLGKAYLEAMQIRPWRQAQRDFPNEILGAVMSSYFGGRAEVHRRREAVRTIYCDFASMYPTVCTLQGLWQFVIATGVDWVEATADTVAFLTQCDLGKLQDPATWRQLTTLVRIKPDADIFPVRARYRQDTFATIGLNYLSADQSFWFTLADCVASKLLTGKTPRIERAIRFAPRQTQRGLAPISIAGNPDYRINPSHDDFYKRLIDLRRSVRAAERRAITAEDKARLGAEQLALKILANATSYGIFIELNVEDTDQQEPRRIQSGTRPFQSLTEKLEVPGKFFHPLLATLITGAARLMLAITERLALDCGLDWVFCDTDSMAFTMSVGAEDTGVDPSSLEPRVAEICRWFEPLNPYEGGGSILELEDQNFTPDKSALLPLYCFAVSAKRYALFNLDENGNPIIRKASAHGLGHLYPPYRSEDPDGPERESGVLLWQEDVWTYIVQTALKGEMQTVPFVGEDSLSIPAASRYSATTPYILRWFRHYNSDRPYHEQIRPFGF